MTLPSQKIRYGIIGFGLFAERAIAPAIQQSKNAELRAIQKRSLSVCREKAEQYHIPLSFSSVAEMVKHPDIDAVFIVSANSAHAHGTILAAEAGKHVLVEKPMAMNVREAEQMIDACSRNGVQLMIGHMIRFSPLILRMKEIVHSGMIGNITFARSDFFYDGRLTKRQWLQNRAVAGGGPVFDIGVHCLDTLRFILNDNVTSCKAHLSPPPTNRETELTAGITMQFLGGTVGSIYCSYDVPSRRSFIELIGTEGILSANDFTLGDRTGTLSIGLRQPPAEYIVRTEKIAIPNLYVEEVERFSKSIIEKTDSPIPGSEGLENQRILKTIFSGDVAAQ
ncbi:MAG: Gfo/Idh/MocA family oxidoreductase [bacterium]